MVINKKMGFSAGFAVLLLLTASFTTLAVSESKGFPSDETVSLAYRFNPPVFKLVNETGLEATVVQIDGLPLMRVNNEPCLPVKNVRILLPKAAAVSEITVETAEEQTYKINNFKSLEKRSRVLAESGNLSDSSSYDVETSEKVFPEHLYKMMGIQYFRGFAILHLNIYPVQFKKEENTFYFYKNMKVKIHTVFSQRNILYRGLRGDELEVSEMVDNPNMVVSYRENNAYSPSYDGNLVDYVIITSKKMLKATGEFTLDDLKSYREKQGLNCRYKTVEDIEQEYTGVDTAEKIRNFIKDIYFKWGTKWVLLAGDVETIPMRYLYDVDGEDNVIPSDLYYQCLDGNYNYDGDDLWGEINDGVGGGWIDLYAEVYIGRAPVDNEEDISAFVEKTLTYEQSNWEQDEYLKKHLSVGEKVWDGPGGWGAGYAERCIDHCTDYGQNTQGIPSDRYDVIKLYERNSSWSKNDIINEINEGVSIINHVGHGSANGAMKLTTYDISSLSNYGKYPLLYSEACDSGRLDDVDDCFAETWVNSEKTGGFAAVMNTRKGYGSTVDYDGPDNRYAREFFDALFSDNEKISRIGKANQDSKQDNIWHIDDENMYHVYYDTTLFGDPYVQIKGAEETEAKFSWSPQYPHVSDYITFHDESTGDIFFREWNFGDGTTIISKKNPVHKYSEPGNYTVELTIWDTKMRSSHTTHEVKVRNKWPPFAIGEPQTYSSTNYTVIFDGSKSFDPDGVIEFYHWDFDDGSTANISKPVHTYKNPGVYHVNLTVWDNDELKGTTWLNIEIGNQMPPVKPQSVDGPSYGFKNKKYVFTVSTTDPENDFIRYHWDFGDGTTTETGWYLSGEKCSVAHSWLKNGTYNIRVKARDIHGAESEWSQIFVFTVGDNKPPVVEIIKPEKGLYILDHKIRGFLIRKPLVIGRVNVVVNAYDEQTGVNQVEFYINDQLKTTVNTPPYTYHWDEKAFGLYTIKVKAIDLLGNHAEKQLKIWKFL